MQREAVVPPSSYRVFLRGETCLDARGGDLVLVRHDSFVAKGIRTVERLRVPAEFCWANHACTVVVGGPNAIVTQEEAHGDVLTPLTGLDAVTYAVVHIPCAPEQDAAAVAFANWAVHLGYGFAQIPADVFNSVTGAELGLGWGGRMVCSTQATRTLERKGYIPRRSPDANLPAHLCQDFGVTLETA